MSEQTSSVRVHRHALSWGLALAYSGGLWLILAHGWAGEAEANEPGLALHVLRDATLLAPVTVAALWLGLTLADRWTAPDGASLWALTLIAAGSATAVVGIGAPVHELLFGSGHALSTPELASHSATDALTALQAHVPVAGLLAVLNGRSGAAGAAGAAGAPTHVAGPRPHAPRRAVVAAGVLGLALAATGAAALDDARIARRLHARGGPAQAVIVGPGQQSPLGHLLGNDRLVVRFVTARHEPVTTEVLAAGAASRPGDLVNLLFDPIAPRDARLYRDLYGRADRWLVLAAAGVVGVALLRRLPGRS